jgi:hypothetical protein
MDMRILVLLAGASIVAGAAWAAAPGLTITRTAAIISVVPEDRADIAVTITPGSAKAPLPKLVAGGDQLRIEGGVKGGWAQSCRRGDKPESLRLRYGAGPALRAQDLAQITVRTPRTLALNIANDAFTEIAPSAGGEVRTAGCGRTSLGVAGGRLILRLDGSGDIVAAGAQTASLTLDGSGDVEIGAVKGALQARLDGSGDIKVNTVAGAADLALNGSGDIKLVSAQAGLNALLNGSGDIVVERAQGDVRLQLDGSGDVGVKAGEATQLAIVARGSGDVRFDGTAAKVSVTANGASTVVVGKAIGPVNVNKADSATVEIGR